jgi:hypothetical protein
LSLFKKELKNGKITNLNKHQRVKKIGVMKALKQFPPKARSYGISEEN